MFERIDNGDQIKGWHLPWVNDDGTIQTPIGHYNINPRSWVVTKMNIDEQYKTYYNVSQMATELLKVRGVGEETDEVRLLGMNQSIYNSRYYSSSGSPYRLGDLPFRYLMRELPMPYTIFVSDGGRVYDIKYDNKDMYFLYNGTYYRDKWSRCKNEYNGRLYIDELYSTSSIGDMSKTKKKKTVEADPFESLVTMANAGSKFYIEMPNKAFLICSSMLDTDYAIAIVFNPMNVPRYRPPNVDDIMEHESIAWFAPVPIYRSFRNNPRADMNQIQSMFRSNKSTRENVEMTVDFIEEYIVLSKEWRDKEWLITFTEKGDKLSHVIGRGQKLIKDYAARKRHVVRHSKYEITISYEFVPGKVIPGMDEKKTKAWKKLHKNDRYILVFEIAGRKRKPTMKWHLYTINPDYPIGFHRITQSGICIDSSADDNNIYIEEDHIASRMLLVMSPANTCMDKPEIYTMHSAWSSPYHSAFGVTPSPLQDILPAIKPYAGRLLKQIGADALSRSRPYGYSPEKEFDLAHEVEMAKKSGA